MSRRRIVVVIALAACAALVGPLAGAALADKGFQLDRYEPTPAGEWLFAVEHPWYSPEQGGRLFAGGLTLDYAHNPLVAGYRDAQGGFTRTIGVVSSQLVGHVDLAAAFADRLLISATLPLTLYEAGTPAAGTGPISGVAVGDPRVGAMVRLYGQPERDALSLHLGLHVWIPIGQNDSATGDSGLRVLPKLAVGGILGNSDFRVRYTVNAGFLFRGDATLGTLAAQAGNTVGNEVQLGAAVGWINEDRTVHVGPELVLGTVAGHAFAQDYTSLEVLLGAHYLISDLILVGAAGGLGVLREPGTPDFRLLLRIAYAPVTRRPRDGDRDGIVDSEDACPTVPGVRTDDPRTNGCPPPPPPPPSDRDHDGVIDSLDQCIDVPQGDRPDPLKPGCPRLDTDKDGVWDDEDLCPTVPQGLHVDPARRGCPAKDSDGDGVFDYEDLCPSVPAGPHPDPDKLGCPGADRDGDTVLDAVDACPDEAGAPNPDPKKNGCPSKVVIKNGMIVILEPVYFATGKDVILPRSFPVLQAVADALSATPGIKRIAVEGHTDDRGKPKKNLDLSERRARSVVRFIVAHGISVERLEAHGYGQDRPIMTNRTDKGRSANRRVEFHIVDPPPPPEEGAKP